MNVSPSVACGPSLSDPGRTVSQALPSCASLSLPLGSIREEIPRMTELDEQTWLIPRVQDDKVWKAIRHHQRPGYHSSLLSLEPRSLNILKKQCGLVSAFGSILTS